MPYRPIQHQISSKAVAKVCDIWSNTGAAVEEIQRDYGEDLLVQTCLNEKLDASRIWVQVKGVQRAPGMRKPGGKAQIRIRADSARPNLSPPRLSPQGCLLRQVHIPPSEISAWTSRRTAKLGRPSLENGCSGTSRRSACLLKIAALLPADLIWRNERVLSSWAALLKCFAYALPSSNVR
jgi:hypothetical protein